jgi:hypothetical protein
MSAILLIDGNLEEYCRELQLLIDLLKELQAACKDNTDYARYIGTVKNDLKMVNKTIQILQNLSTNTLALHAIKLCHPPNTQGIGRNFGILFPRSAQNSRAKIVIFRMININCAMFIVI